jgi:hypothetical protein
MGEADSHWRAVPRFLGGSEIDNVAPIPCPQLIQSGVESPELLVVAAAVGPPLLLVVLNEIRE